MRITGGEYRGRLLQSPKDRTIRPTSDKVRLAIFNILNSRGLVQQAVVLDAFCGTGALGLEALSWGALCCTFMDKNRESLSLSKENFAALKIDAKQSFLLKDATKPGEKPAEIMAADLVFLDPPYRQDLIPASLSSLEKDGWIAQGAHILVESEDSFDPAGLSPLGYDVLMIRDYGDTRIALLKRNT